MITLSLLHPVKQTPVQIWTFAEDESLIRIGRSTDNQVILYSAVVSRYHVELRRNGGNWELVNLGTNGTYLNGKRITQIPIESGAIIRLARSGPNLQIRLGADALEGLSSAVSSGRTANSALPQMPTEITNGYVPQPHSSTAEPEASVSSASRTAPL